MKTLFTAFLSLLVSVVAAQKIENLKVVFADGKVIINYDLAGGKANQKYNVSLYASHNNYSSPLRMVSGDVGESRTGGATREVIWDAKQELGKYKGEISFKIRAEVLPLPFEFISPTTNGSVRRGKATQLKWEGGTPGQALKLEVYKGGERVAAVADTKNTGVYSWSVPKDFTKGADYTLRISDGGQTVNSNVFAVKAKVPLLLKLSPLLIGAAIIPFLGGSDSPDDATPDVTKLAAAPNPN